MLDLGGGLEDYSRRQGAAIGIRESGTQLLPAGRTLAPVDEATLAEAVRRLVEALQPGRIYLFGSRARGDAHQDSDYDFLHPSLDSEGVPLLELLEPTPREVKRALALTDEAVQFVLARLTDATRPRP